MRTRAFGAALLLLSACGAMNRPEEEGRFEVFVLGIAQDGGLPHLGCRRDCCEEARRSGRSLAPACLGVKDRETGKLLLIEATRAVERQVALLHRLSGSRPPPGRPVDALLITHAHVGHYTGLIQFGREVAATEGTPVHVSEAMARFLEKNGPWKQCVELGQIRLHRLEPSRPFEPIPGLRVTAIPVPHRQEYSDTLAFRLQGTHGTVLFVPDIDRWGNMLQTLIEDVDRAYLDATFYDGRELPGRDLGEIPHPPMVETMERLREAAGRQPGRFRFIHLNHTNPALHEEGIRRRIEERGFRVAEEGERWRF